jgi:hypothetical protein
VRNLTVLGLVAASLASGVRAQGRITQADLLRRVIDVQRLTTPAPVGERTALHSPGRDLAAARRDEAGWDILLDLPGPGAITRVWFARPAGDIRLILDGQTVIDTTLETLLSGRLAPVEEPLVCRGANCYFPFGFNERCAVLRRASASDYQINTVQFPRGTEVEPFTPTLDAASQAALAEVQRTLKDGFTDKQLFGDQRLLPVAVEQELGPDEVLSEAVEKPGTVRGLYVALTDRSNPQDVYALHRCILRIFVDGEKTPSVEAPLCDFFGSGFDLLPVNSLVLGTNTSLPIPLPERRSGEDRFMYCLLPMPYRDGLRVEIENLNESKKKIGLLLHMRVDTRPPAPDALRFHARFRKEDPCRGAEFPILEAAGRGRVVGCVLDIDCPRAAWWGAGPEQLWLDGEKSPAYVGTDTAAYFGQVPPLEPDARALEGVARAGPYGKSAAYRWSIADCINFQKSIRFTVGNAQARGLKDTYYGSVVYWYGDPGARNFFKPLKVADVVVPGLRIPGAIEIEDHIRGTDWGTFIKQRFADGAELSGKEAANITTEQPVQVNIPSDAERTALLKLRVNPRRSFETVAVRGADGSTVGIVSYDRTTDGIYTVGAVHLHKGDNWMTVQCGRPAMLDCWILEELPPQ